MNVWYSLYECMIELYEYLIEHVGMLDWACKGMHERACVNVIELVRMCYRLIGDIWMYVVEHK